MRKASHKDLSVLRIATDGLPGGTLSRFGRRCILLPEVLWLKLLTLRSQSLRMLLFGVLWLLLRLGRQLCSRLLLLLLFVLIFIFFTMILVCLLTRWVLSTLLAGATDGIMASLSFLGYRFFTINLKD